MISGDIQYYLMLSKVIINHIPENSTTSGHERPHGASPGSGEIPGGDVRMPGVSSAAPRAAPRAHKCLGVEGKDGKNTMEIAKLP